MNSKTGFSIALGVLVLALAAGSLVALVPPPHQQARGPDDNTDDMELRFIAFTNKEGREEGKLALTTYDLSIAGFANGTGHWFAFPNHGFRFPKASTTILPFGNSYRDLIGGLANLPRLPLGRDPTAQATRVLNHHDPAVVGEDDEDLKRALATLAVMFTEAMRLTPIQETVSQGWESGDARVAAEHLPYIEHWDAICHEILRANKNGKVWNGPFTDLLRDLAGIRGLEDALAVVAIIGQRNMQQVLEAHLRTSA
ncbi:hypothetical protein QOZ80_4BG0358210 [Eleusine coracana subsp. coracana]|nr:hypothetical protein QOZ80_4BG0358210 [Eleusine coracana subsp. coracana]